MTAASVLSILLISGSLLLLLYALRAKPREEGASEVETVVRVARVTRPAVVKRRTKPARISVLAIVRNRALALVATIETRRRSRNAESTPRTAPEKRVSLEETAVLTPIAEPPETPNSGVELARVPPLVSNPWYTLLPVEVPAHLAGELTIDRRLDLVATLDAIRAPWCADVLTAAAQQESDSTMQRAILSALRRQGIEVVPLPAEGSERLNGATKAAEIDADNEARPSSSQLHHETLV